MELIMAPGRVLLEKVVESEVKTDKGIILLRGSKTSLIKAKAIKVGPDLPERKMGIAPGDYVYFKKGSELEIEYQNKKYWTITWNDYLMIERG